VSFLDGIDLSDAAERALTADLELRRKDERMDDRFFRYPYRGGADFVLRHGEFWQGRVRPHTFDHLLGEPGRCYRTSFEAAKADDRLLYVEGYCTTGAGMPISHAWVVEVATGGIFDLVLPCGDDQISVYRRANSKLDFAHPSKWAYYGVRFLTELVVAHDKAVGLPLLDRPAAEAAENAGRPNAEIYSEDHDFPILKIPYDFNRTSLP
jgi:hypothetical protein